MKILDTIKKLEKLENKELTSDILTDIGFIKPQPILPKHFELTDGYNQIHLYMCKYGLKLSGYKSNTEFYLDTEENVLNSPQTLINFMSMFVRPIDLY